MSLIVSIALLALGSVLYFAVGWQGAGLALMIVGAVAAAVSVLQLAVSTRRGRRPPTQPM